MQCGQPLGSLSVYRFILKTDFMPISINHFNPAMFGLPFIVPALVHVVKYSSLCPMAVLQSADHQEWESQIFFRCTVGLIDHAVGCWLKLEQITSCRRSEQTWQVTEVRSHADDDLATYYLSSVEPWLQSR